MAIDYARVAPKRSGLQVAASRISRTTRNAEVCGPRRRNKRRRRKFAKSRSGTCLRDGDIVFVRSNGNGKSNWSRWLSLNCRPEETNATQCIYDSSFASARPHRWIHASSTLTPSAARCFVRLSTAQGGGTNIRTASIHNISVNLKVHLVLVCSRPTSNRGHPLGLRRADREQPAAHQDLGRDGPVPLPRVVRPPPLPRPRKVKMVPSPLGPIPQGWEVNVSTNWRKSLPAKRQKANPDFYGTSRHGS